MLDPTKQGVPSKCFFTLGQLPKFNDSKQPPSKTKPFSSILEHPFIHSLDLLIPLSLYNVANTSISESLPDPQFALVTLTLSSILSGDFFTTYIKTGTIALQSLPPPPGSNSPIITLYNGVLRLELPRDLYERCGLSGQAIRSGGRKHIPERFAVEFNLRLPSMVAGRKGFERLKRAADNVLNAETKFLFADCERSVDGKATVSLMDEARPLWAFKPIVKKAETKVLEHSVLVPPMDLARSAGNKNAQSADLEDAVFEEEAMDLLEWLDLAMLPSPRVAVGDGIDPFLSRYAVPGTELGETEEQDVVCVSWRGFLPSDWVRDVLTLWLNAARKESSHWFAMSGHLFRTAAVDAKLGWTVLRPPEGSFHVPGKDSEANADGADVTMHPVGDDEHVEKTIALGGPQQLPDNKGIKPFPRFALYEMTAGEHG